MKKNNIGRVYILYFLPLLCSFMLFGQEEKEKRARAKQWMICQGHTQDLFSFVPKQEKECTARKEQEKKDCRTHFKHMDTLRIEKKDEIVALFRAL